VQPEASREVFHGRLIRVEVETWPYGEREIVRHPGACAVVAMTRLGEVVMVRQQREAIRRDLLEIPAGVFDVEGEDAVVSTSAAPSIHVRLRPVDGAVLAERDEARARMDEYRARRPVRRDPYYAAQNAAREHGLHAESAIPPVA